MPGQWFANLLRMGVSARLHHAVPALIACWLILALAPGARAAEPLPDTDLVYCLSPDHRDDLVAAGITLGAASKGPDPDHIGVDSKVIPLEDWPDADAVGFDRACLTLREVAEPTTTSSAGYLIVLPALLGAVTGALLTGMVTSRRELGNRRREQAARLRAAVRSFRIKAQHFVRCRQEIADADWKDAELAMWTAQSELMTQLAQATGSGGSSALTESLIRATESAPLGEELLDWSTGRDTKASRIASALDALVTRIDQYAHEIEP